MAVLFEAIKKDLKVLMKSSDLIPILKEHVSEYPYRMDYHLGKDGITLEQSDEIRAYMKSIGLSTTKNGKEIKAKTLVSKYKREVRNVVDELIAWTDKNEFYLGNACYGDLIGNFCGMTKACFITQMKQNYAEVYPTKPSPSECNSWGKSFTTLKKALKKCDKHQNLTILFEYVLPSGKYSSEKGFLGQVGGRADAIILSKNIVTVLEFKDRTFDACKAAGYMNQAKKYADRIRKYHVEAAEQKIKTILVCIPETGLNQKMNGITICSPDILGETLLHLCEVVPHEDPFRWQHTQWRYETAASPNKSSNH